MFLDTTGLLARWESDDQWHTAARWSWDSKIEGRCDVFTTSYVLLECANKAARRNYRRGVVEFRQGLITGNRLITPTDEDIETAWRIFQNGRPGGPAVVDLVSFQVIRRYGIRRAFTNDRHFTEAGFDPLF